MSIANLRHHLVPVAAVGVSMALASAASADLISLSTHSSDETPASMLAGTLDFSVSGNTLSIVVANGTASPNEYRLSEIFFNVPDTLSNLALTTAGWSLLLDEHAGGFGVFDVSLRGGTGSDPDQVPAGQSLTFTLTFDGTAAAADFVSELSTLPPGNMAAIVAAKFTGGPGDDSAYGATVPAPASALALIMPLALGRRRR